MRSITTTITTKNDTKFFWLPNQFTSIGCRQYEFQSQSQCLRKRNQSNWIHNVPNCVSFEQMNDISLARSPLTSTNQTKTPNQSIDLWIFVMFCDSCVSISFSRQLFCELSFVAGFMISNVPVLLFTAVNCRLLTESSFEFNKTIILILQFNDLCSQWGKWIKPCTKSAIQHTSYIDFESGFGVFVWYRVQLYLSQNRLRMYFVLVIWLALIILWMWLFIIIATIHHSTFDYRWFFHFYSHHHRRVYLSW